MSGNLKNDFLDAYGFSTKYYLPGISDSNLNAAATAGVNAAGGSAYALAQQASGANVDNFVIKDKPATLWIGSTAVPITEIKVVSGDKMLLSYAGGTQEYQLRVRPPSMDTAEGVQTAQFTTNMLNNASELNFITNIAHLASTAAIGDVNITDKDGATFSGTLLLAAGGMVVASAQTPFDGAFANGNPKMQAASLGLIDTTAQRAQANGSSLSNLLPILKEQADSKITPTNRPSSATDLIVGKTFNDRANGNNRSWYDESGVAGNGDYTFKIGDVILRIPPTHLTISQLRTSAETDMIGFYSFSSASPVSRTVFKINAVFSGHEIDGDLKRLITQFTYCPFNIIHSADLANIILSSESALASAIPPSAIPYVPVTMDEYTIYTIEGHPDTLGCTMQFSLFNFVPYFDGDTSEAFKYTTMKFDEKGQGILANTIQSTTHLEDAIHPYNFDIMEILKESKGKWFSNGEFFDDAKSIYDDDKMHQRSKVRIHKLSTFQEIDFEIINEQLSQSVIELLCESTSVRYENKFAWFPIGGYSAAAAQYIGPGSTVMNISAKVSFNDSEKLSRLLTTYHDLRSKDQNSYYDDRYYVHSAMTRLTNCMIASISDIAMTSLPNHPGYSDVNIMLRKSPYVHATTNSNKIAEQDPYWGMQRVVKAVETNKELLAEVSSQLSEEREQAYNDFAWLAKWAENGKTTSTLSTVDPVVSQMLNAAASSVYTSTAVTGEKLVIERMKLISSGTNTVDITELLSDLTNHAKTLITGFAFTTFGVPFWGSVIRHELKGGSKKDFWRSFVSKVILNYKGIFLAKVSITYDQAKPEIENLSKLTSETEITDAWVKLEPKIKDLLDNIQPSYDFTNYSLNTLGEIKKDKYRQIQYQCELSAANQKDGITSEAITSVFNQITGYALSKRVGELTIDTVTSGTLQIAILVPSDKASEQLSVVLEKMKKDAVYTKQANNIVINFVQPPMAAHRYYPQCQAMVNIDPRFSCTPGSYFYTKIISTEGHFYDFIDKLRRNVASSVSPAFDFKAWAPHFPNGSDAQKMQQKADAGNDPFWLLQAIAMPEMRKEINSKVSEYNKQYGLTSTSPMMEMASNSINAFSANKDANNRPFSGLSDWAYMSKISGENVYGSPAVSKLRTQINAKQTQDYKKPNPKGTEDQSKTDGKETILSPFHQNMNRGLGVGDETDSNYMLKSLVSPFYTNSIGDQKAYGFDASMNVAHKYGGQFNVLAHYATVQKNPALLVPKKTTNENTPTSPNTANVQSHTPENDIAKIKTLILKYLAETPFKNMESVKGIMVEYIGKYIGAVYYSPTFSKINSVSSGLELDEEVAIALYSAILAFNDSFNKRQMWKKGADTRSLHVGDIIKASRKNYLFQYRLLEGVMGEKLEKAPGGTQDPTPFMHILFDATLLVCSLQELGVLSESPTQFASFGTADSTIMNDIIKHDALPSSSDEQGSLANLPIPIFKHFRIAKVTEEPITLLRVALKQQAKNTKNKTSLKVGDVAKLIKESLEVFSVGSTLESQMTDSANPSTSTQSVHNNNSTFLISQFMQGMLPTFGLQNAFPTYKVYIIDQNLSDIRFHSLDQWYDFRLVKDLMIIKSKEDPAHLLKCRVIVDERFITTNLMVPMRGFDRTPIEHKEVNPSLETMGTELESSFYGGKAPLRVGMRICVKLGYHTDPRLLDTVFIGTITELQGSMERYVFDLEAQGDGRELSAPAATTSVDIDGLNFSEVIAKVLRSNQSVFHFGKNYGTTIERFTRDHHILYGVALSCFNGMLKTEKDIQSKLLTGTSGNTGAGLGFGANVAIGLGVTGLNAVSPTLSQTLVAGATVLAGSNTYKLLREKHVPSQTIAYIKEAINKRATAYSSDGNIFNFRKVLDGNTFDAAKWSGQVFAHFRDTYKYGNDPIDDNIWAVDIWTEWTNATVWGNGGFKVTASNQISVWKLLQGIKRVYPNYAVDVRPYGGRSTLYFGPLNWLMWRTDDPILAMTSQMYETSNEHIAKKLGTVFDAMALRDDLLDSTSDAAMPPLVEFQKTHLASSDSNIIFNGIQSTPSRGWNAVVVNCGKESYDALANAELHPGVIRTKVENVEWTTHPDIAQQYALGLLKEGVEKMYGGTLALRGNPKIEPYDRIYICDKINRMYGWIEVETVIHKFDTNFGYTTHVTPNMVCSVNSDSYKTTAQLIRSMITSEATQAAVANFLTGGAVGYTITAVAGTVLTGGLATALAIIGGLGFLYTAQRSIRTSIEASIDVLAAGRGQDVDLMELLEAAHRDSLYATAFNKGMYYGFITGYLNKIYTLGFTEALTNSKSFASTTGTILTNSFNKVWLRTTTLNPFAVGRGGAYTLGLINKYATMVEKLSGVKNTIDITKTDISKVNDLKVANDALKTLAAEAETELAKTTLGTEKIKELKASMAEGATKIQKEIVALEKTVSEGGTLKSRPTTITEGANIEKGYGSTKRLIGGLVKMSAYQFFIEMVNVIPNYLETYLVSYMAKANCITISPLWNKNVMMMAGLDGFQKTNAFMHMRNMVINAKRVLDDMDRSASYSLPTAWSSPIPSDAQSKADAIMKKKSLSASQRAASSNVNRTKRVMDVGKNTSAILNEKLSKIPSTTTNLDCIKEALTPEFILSIMDYESGGDKNAIGRAHKDDPGLTSGRGLMQLTASNYGVYFLNNAPSSLKNSEWGQMIMSGTASYAGDSPEAMWLRQEMCNYPDANIAGAIDGLIANAKKEAAYGCGRVNGYTLQERIALCFGPPGPGWRTRMNQNATNYKRSNLDVMTDYLGSVNTKMPIYKNELSSSSSKSSQLITVAQPPQTASSVTTQTFMNAGTIQTESDLISKIGDPSLSNINVTYTKNSTGSNIFSTANVGDLFTIEKSSVFTKDINLVEIVSKDSTGMRLKDKSGNVYDVGVNATTMKFADGRIIKVTGIIKGK